MTNSDLVRHMDMHNSMETYKCDVCDKAFSMHSDLETHMIEHTGEKLHQCNQCGKAFSMHSDMIKHMYEHTGEKPYQCNHCEKSFILESVLLAHLVTSYSYDPHKCRQCENAFVNMSRCNCKPHHCRKCEKNFAQINECHKTEINLTPNNNVLNNTFKGIRFINPKDHNLCYLNSTINSFLNCQNVLNLVNSDLDCKLIKMIKPLLNKSNVICTTGSLCDFLISNNYIQFSDNSQ